MAKEPSITRAGIAVDAEGNPVVDPTKNVLDLVEAMATRQDDLREANNRYVESAVLHIKEMMALRAEHAKDIGELESNRLNAIRQVDVLAVSTAADRAQAAINALAATAAADAQKLRDTLTATAQTNATTLAATVTTITERISALEKTSYESKGKSALSDPQMVDLLAEMKSLKETRANVTGKVEGIGHLWGWLVGIVGLLAAVIPTVVLLLR